MHDLRRHFLVIPGSSADLGRRDPGDHSAIGSREHAAERLKKDAKGISELQRRLYAERGRALLVILQGMDTSGKDGATKAVFGRTSPLGVAVTSFQKPSPDELAHDFLRRVHLACPRRGTIGIFNRSHYEDVLVGRVRQAAPADAIERRYGQINSFEELLSGSTTIVKIMLHISKETQKERLQARLDKPHKRWKFDPHDLEDRRDWDAFTDAYEIALSRCSTAAAPWFVVPSDRKWARNAVVAAIVRETLEEMDPRYPEPDIDPASVSIV